MTCQHGLGSGLRRSLLIAPALVLALVPVLAPSTGEEPAYAVQTTAYAGITASASAAVGRPGYCHDSTSVTVVVDFSDLGGDIVVRCARGPVSPGYSGLDALRGAGFTVSGTQRWGLAFVCRIQGRPAANESLQTRGNPDYHERCVDTPPASAYWGYWYAKNRGSWIYSSSGPTSRDAIKGGFEGWSFSLDHQTGRQPAPGVAPRRPATSQPPTSPAPSSPGPSGPTGSAPTAGGPGGPGGAQSHGPAPSNPSSNGTVSDETSAPGSSTASGPRADGRPGRNDTGGAGKHEQPSSSVDTSTPTTGPSAPTKGTARVTGELPTDPSADSSDSSSKVGTLWGVGVLVALAAGAGVTAWRRSRRA